MSRTSSLKGARYTTTSLPCCGSGDCLAQVRRAGAVVDAWPTDPEAAAVVREVEG